MVLTEITLVEHAYLPRNYKVEILERWYICVSNKISNKINS